MKDTEYLNSEEDLDQEEMADQIPETEAEEIDAPEEDEESQDDFDIFSEDELLEDELPDELDEDESGEEGIPEDEQEIAEEPPPTVAASGLEKYQALNNRAKEIFKARHGVDYDEFEDSHRDALNDVKTVLKREEEALDVVDNIYKQNDPGFIEFVKREAYEAKNGDMQALRDAEARGDFSKTVNFLKQIETKYKARKKAGGLGSSTIARQEKRSVNPPKTMTPGTGRVPATRPDSSVLSPEDLGFE